jgi:hypothetical protein
MKFTLAALLMLAAIWLYPLAAEVRGGACGALASAEHPDEAMPGPCGSIPE